MKKYLPVVVALLAVGSLGSIPATAQTLYRPAPHAAHQPLYMYAPRMGSAVTPDTPAYTPYPNGEQITGSQANRAEWDPSYVPGAPD